MAEVITKKVNRYYSECGRGFWKKAKAITHNQNCKCWKNPKFKTCISCKHKSIIDDSDDCGQFWSINNCKNSENGIPIHKDYKHIRKECPFYENK